MIVTLRRGRAVLSHHESLTDALRIVAASDGPERRTVRALAPFTFLSICSGIEAASIAWSPLGWRALGFAEIEKFPSAVLAHHYPNVPNHGDFTKIDAARYRGRVDILCGGTPCQAFSVAGSRNSLDDARGNLTLAFVDLAHAINPRNVVWENVPGVLSTKDNAFGCFLAGLVGAPDALVPIAARPAPGRSTRAWGWSAKSGAHYVKWPRSGMVDGPKGRAAWTIKDAQYFGLAQRRERVLVVADFGNGADPAAVLFEPEGVRRHSPPSRETGQGIAPTISARTKGGGGLETDFDLDGGLIARTLLSGGHSNNPLDENLIAVSVSGSISHALAAEGADASEDGTGRGTPIVTVAHETGQGWWKQDDVAGTLRAEGENRPSRPSHAIVQTVALRGRDGGATAELGDDVAFALRASGGGGDKPHVLAQAIAFNYNAQVAQLPGPNRDTSVNDGLTCSQGAAVVLSSAVRRLTPRECERLQGFQFLCSPDYPGAWQDDAGRWWSPDYTAIPKAADGPRYKSLGNSWAVPKFRWLGRRIQRLMPPRR